MEEGRPYVFLADPVCSSARRCRRRSREQVWRRPRGSREATREGGRPYAEEEEKGSILAKEIVGSWKEEEESISAELSSSML